MMRGKGKGRTYIAFLYHACQALKVRITADGPFKVDIRNGDLEGFERVKIIGLFGVVLDPHAQKRFDMAKFELKEYMKKAVRHRDGLEIVEKISSKHFAHNNTRRGKSKMDSDGEPKYARIQDDDRRGIQRTTGKIGSNYLDEAR